MLRGKVYDNKQDIWSLGCIAYRLLTGRPAFFPRNACECDYDRLSSTKFAPEIIALVDCLLHPHPTGRPTAIQFRDQIRALMKRA